MEKVEKNSDVCESFTKERIEKCRRTDTGVDFILPDYMGDIKRMLNFSAELLPAGQYRGDGELSHSGVVAYSVLYLDSENKLTEADFTSDFELSTKISQNFVSADIKSEISSLNVRVGGPRKLIAKACVSSDIYITEEEALPGCNGHDGFETREKYIMVHKCEYLKLDDVEFAEEACMLPGVSSEEAEVILCHGKSRVLKQEMTADGVDIEGEICAVALLLIGGEKYISVEKKLPVSAKIPAGELTVGDVSAKIIVGSVNVGLSNTVTEDGGVGASVVFNTVCDFSARVDCEREICIITDAYCTEGEGSFDFSDISYSKYIGSYHDSQTFSFEDKIDEVDFAAGGEILFVDMKARVERVEKCGDATMIFGEAAFSMVGTCGDGCVNIKRNYPFNVKAMVPFFDGAMNDIDINFSYPTVEMIDGGIKISVACDVDMRSFVSESSTLLASASITPVQSKRENSIIVCYPAPTDTLWDIAKRYNIPGKKIAADNLLDSEVLSKSGESMQLSGVKRLLIKLM